MTEIKMSHEEMKKAVIEAANAFYNGRATTMNDLVYDEMLKMIVADEPTFNIYDHITYENDGISLPHKVIFRDFSKLADIQEFSEDDFNTYKDKYYVLPKFDGSSVVIELNDGKIDRILSRGDDEFGFLNTNKLRAKAEEAIQNRLVTLYPDKQIKFILAECVCNLADGGRAQANGAINSKYCQETVDKCLHVMPFDVYFEDGSKSPNLYYEIKDYSIFNKLKDTSILDTQFGEIPCDGIVGYSRDSNNEVLDIHKIYFTEKAETTIRDIEWNYSWNSGIYHPTAVFDPVDLDGTTVSRASLFNYQNVLETGIRIGSIVHVIKANMTIPQIIDSQDLGHNEDGSIKPYEVLCPWCGKPLVEHGVDLICTNPQCDFWNFVFKWRIFETFKPNTVGSWETIASTPATEFKFIKDILPSDWIDKIYEIENLLWILLIPRVGEAKINRIAEESKKVKDKYTFDEAIEFIGNWLSDAQYEYMMKVTPALKWIITKLENA